VAGWQRESTGRGVSLYRSFDLLFFSLFVYFTAGPSSPFFAFFVFSLVVGTVRWQWKGAVWTAVVSLATLLAVGVYFSEVRVDPDFEPRTVAMEERVRLARDLHDGVLQSMTVFGLQLAAARRRLPEDPEAVGRSLEELQQLIASEQRDLRFFIDEVRPLRGEVALGRPLPERLRDLGSRIEREWGLKVDLEAEVVSRVSDDLAREIYHLVREGLVNAARHAGASRARVELADSGDGEVAIRVADDGQGFSFKGSFDDRELVAAGGGPRSLLERIESLGGRLTLDSEVTGSCLTITLPR
jgi:signal transduction histidine kinase